jgi:hypothetical protein
MVLGDVRVKAMQFSYDRQWVMYQSATWKGLSW